MEEGTSTEWQKAGSSFTDAGYNCKHRCEFIISEMCVCVLMCVCVSGWSAEEAKKQATQ